MTATSYYEGYSGFPMHELPLGVRSSGIRIRLQIGKDQFRVYSLLLHLP